MFLPITREEMNQRGWDEVDFVLVTGDAHVLEKVGFRLIREEGNFRYYCIER